MNGEGQEVWPTLEGSLGEPRPEVADVVSSIHVVAEPLTGWGRRLEEAAESAIYQTQLGNGRVDASEVWTSLLNAVSTSHPTYASVIPPILLSSDARIQEGDLKEEREKGQRGRTIYKGPQYEYETEGTEGFEKTHPEEVWDRIREAGFAIEHKFRQFLRITYNTVVSGTPRAAEHVYEGWDSLKMPEFSWLDRLPKRGPIGPEAGEIPPKILEGGDYPALAPGGAWSAPKGHNKGDKAQFLFQFMTIRCHRTVKDGIKSEWFPCGIWFWWILFVFTVVDENGPKVKGTYKKGNGTVPKSVQKEAGLKDKDVIGADLRKTYHCNSN